ncbi:MAG: CopG family transcriptional regulator [Acidobacteriota bacterium]|nr:CopG family transcriptional regulator [Acidobacteriota bacterium]
MHRTQLYLDDQLWTALRTLSLSTNTTVSELVRGAVRDRYLGDLNKRHDAMQALVGLRNDRQELEDTESYVRELRRGARLDSVEQA